jgi:transposase InsO family protein
VNTCRDIAKNEHEFRDITSWNLHDTFRVTDVTLEVVFMHDEYTERLVAIRRYLAGEPAISIYTDLGRSPTWFYKWRARYDQKGIEGLHDISRAPKHHAHKTTDTLETAIVRLRLLREQRDSDDTKYGLIGAFAIQKDLRDLGYQPPSVRTVHRILVRHGCLVAPPEEQTSRTVIDRHYPALAITAPGQLQQLDLVGPRYLEGSGQKYYFCTLRDVCSRRVAIEVSTNHQATTVVDALCHMWQRMGMPRILQHDNAMEFRGSPRTPHSAGALTKFCVALDIETLFIPVRQPYRNGTIENFNGLFQRLVLRTQQIETLERLQLETRAFEQAANTQHPHIPLNGQTSDECERSYDFVPTLLPKLCSWASAPSWSTVPDGKVSFICRIRKSGRITIVSERFDIDPDLAWDYVYATIFVKEQRVKIYHKGTVIKEFPYELRL